MKSMDNASSAQLLTKTQAEEFDPVILGGGTGSTLAAWKFAGHGKRVAVIERKYIGGSCPNIACLPSKNIIHSAKIASYSRRGKEFGMACDGFSIDMSGVRDRKRRMVSGLNAMYLEIYRNTGAESAEATGKKSARRYVRANRVGLLHDEHAACFEAHRREREAENQPGEDSDPPLRDAKRSLVGRVGLQGETPPDGHTERKTCAVHYDEREPRDEERQGVLKIVDHERKMPILHLRVRHDLFGPLGVRSLGTGPWDFSGACAIPAATWPGPLLTSSVRTDAPTVRTAKHERGRWNVAGGAGRGEPRLTPTLRRVSRGGPGTS